MVAARSVLVIVLRTSGVVAVRCTGHLNDLRFCRPPLSSSNGGRHFDTPFSP